ncbi:hypothetical protein PsWM33_00560 [Pseudovibrio sp. WM33]|nr:hypothetical protein PsWM33_00560 [Pseudovibrio sp. WM33]
MLNSFCPILFSRLNNKLSRNFYHLSKAAFLMILVQTKTPLKAGSVEKTNACTREEILVIVFGTRISIPY